MRAKIGLAALLLAGCSPGVSSVPHASGPPGRPPAGLAYQLPKGLVPFQVFADADSVGVTVEPAVMIGDAAVGTLVARIRPSPFNNEDFKLVADPATGLLTSVNTDSEAKILEIVEEAAKAAARIALQSGRDAVWKSKVVLLTDSFDPLSPSDVQRAEAAMRAAVARGISGFPGRGREFAPVSLSVQAPGGTTVAASAEPDPRLDTCREGVCARVMTTRVIRIALGGATLGSKVVAIPAAEVIAVPVPQTILANQKIAITMSGGILSAYDIERDSELLGLVKIPGAILSGIVAGAVQGFTDIKTVSDKRKEAADSVKAEAEAIDARTSSIDKQNTGTPESAYSATTLTVYPFLKDLAALTAERKAAAKDRRPSAPASAENDLVEKKQ